jgi:hypothetical protein
MEGEERRRNARYLERELERLDFSDVEDRRGEHGKKEWEVKQLSNVMVVAAVAGKGGFRQMEKLTERLSPEFRWRLGIRRRLPDNVARNFAAKALWRDYRDVLRAQAKSLYRSKAMARPEDVMIGMISIDGKYRCVNVRKDRARQYPYFQAVGAPNGKWQKGEVRSISVSAVSCRATFCLDCIPVRRETNEMGMFPEVLTAVLADWRDTELAELIATDSGSASLKNASLVNDSGCGYLMVLDAFQPELHREAQRQLSSLAADKADARWEQRYRGRTVVYHLWRTTAMTGWNGWDHLRQVIRLERREISDNPTGKDTTGTRYFLTNLPVGRLTADQWIPVLRLRWSVENGTHWTLDAAMGEDKQPWSRDPNGMLVVQMLRRMALNIVALFRGVHLRSAKHRLRPWKDLMEDFADTLKTARAEDLMDRRELKRLAAVA